MKILILAQSRSGSTTLYNNISKKLKIETLWEPFHPESQSYKYKEQADKIKTSNNLLVKIIDNHFYIMEEFSDYKNIIKYFDKTIGLTRESDIDNANSYYLAKKTGNWLGIQSKTISDVEINNDEYSKILESSFKNRNTILSFDIFQVTYEGLYKRKNQCEDLESYLGFSLK